MTPRLLEKNNLSEQVLNLKYIHTHAYGLAQLKYEFIIKIFF